MALNIALHRLYKQHLEGGKFYTAAEVVAWQGAVQAQEYALAKWALGLRMEGATDASLEQAFNEGAILRTHVMRPTWHFVAPADIRWLLALTAPRVNAVNAYMYRKLELDDDLLRRSNAAITKALEGGKQLTRAELGKALANIGITSDGMRLGYIVHRAELDAIICSGARRGKQFTYALIEERVPPVPALSREEALAELTKRFFMSHSPATPHDFAWWSGLTVADAKVGLTILGSALQQEVIDGDTYWYSSANFPVEEPPLNAYLLPPYDEYGIAYRNHRGVLDPAHLDLAKGAIFGGITVIGGHALGSWRRTIERDQVLIESAPYRPLTTNEQEAFAAAAQRFGEFLGLPVVL